MDLEKFNQKECIEKISAYYETSQVQEKRQRDFFNLMTGEFTCGKCNKTMSSGKALFHFHLPSFVQ